MLWIQSTVALCYAYVLSSLWLFAAPCTVACQAPLPVEFSMDGYWSGLSFPSPGALSLPRDQTHISCVSCIWQADSLPLSHLGSPTGHSRFCLFKNCCCCCVFWCTITKCLKLDKNAYIFGRDSIKQNSMYLDIVNKIHIYHWGAIIIEILQWKWINLCLIQCNHWNKTGLKGVEWCFWFFAEFKFASKPYKSSRKAWNRFFFIFLRRNQPLDIMILGFQSLAWWKKNFMLFKTRGLKYFVLAALQIYWGYEKNRQ